MVFSFKICYSTINLIFRAETVDLSLYSSERLTYTYLHSHYIVKFDSDYEFDSFQIKIPGPNSDEKSNENAKTNSLFFVKIKNRLTDISFILS